MEFISLIIYVIFTLTITASAPIGYYTSKQFGKQNNNDVPAKSNIFVSCENLADLIESSTGNVRFQNDITQPHVYQTEGKQPVVALVDTSTKLSKSSDRPLQWTLPDSQRWFTTRLQHKRTSRSSVASTRQSNKTQSTVRRRLTISSSLPSTPGHYDEVTELSTLQKSVYISQSTEISRMISTPGLISQNKDYVAILMFDDHGHIVRRLVEKVLIDAATATTQEDKKL